MAHSQGHAYFGSGNTGSQVYKNTGQMTNNFYGQNDLMDAMSRLFLTDPTVSRSNLAAEKGERVPGTCEWIFQHPTFLAWLESSTSSLWLTGGPGKGKTMIALHVTKTLEARCSDSECDTVLYFFCTDKDATQNSATASLRGLIYQFVQRQPSLERHCRQSLSKSNYEQTLSSFGALWDMFMQMLDDQKLGQVFCVLDGFDECDRDSRAKSLGKFDSIFPGHQEKPLRKFKLLVASRDSGGMPFEPDGSIQMDSINSMSTRVDISLFVDCKLGKLARSIENFHDIEQEVRQTLIKRADGTFLWIGLAIRELETSGTESAEDVVKMLEDIPKGLDHLYDRLLKRIRPQTSKVLLAILRWILVARRPMTISELTTALEMKDLKNLTAVKRLRDRVKECRNFLQTIPGDHVQFQQPPRSPDFHHLCRSLPQKLLSLAFYDSDEGRKAHEKLFKRGGHTPFEEVKYIQHRLRDTKKEELVIPFHKSMRDYFLSHFGQVGAVMEQLPFNEQVLQLSAAQNALQYLSNGILTHEWTCFNLPEVDKLHPFLHYACTSWVWHAQRTAGAGLELLKSTAPFFQSTKQGSTLRLNWLLSYKLECGKVDFAVEFNKGRVDWPLLLIAAAFGLSSWIHQLLPNRHSPTQTAVDTATDSLVYAIQQNNTEVDKTEVVGLLLERGVTPNWPAFVSAFSPEKEDILKLLIQYGDVDVIGELDDSLSFGKPYLTTPLKSAFRESNWRVIQLLVDGGAKVETSLASSLVAASGSSVEPKFLYRILEDRPTEKAILEAAMAAASSGETQADARGMVNLQTPVAGRALQHPPASVFFERLLRQAAKNGLSNTVKHLCDNHVNLGATDEAGCTAALFAIGFGFQKVADFLLLLEDRTLDARTLAKHGSGTLYLAVFTGNIKGVAMLLASSVGIDITNTRGVTPLMIAAQTEHNDMLVHLLTAGTRVGAVDKKGRMALHHAVMHERVANVVSLLKYGTPTNTVDTQGRSALHYAQPHDHEIISLLVLKGCDAKLLSISGRNASHLRKKKLDAESREHVLKGVKHLFHG
jgi:hypothetical protein